MESAAHTAEHVFMRYLMSLNDDIIVRKVEQNEDFGKITVQGKGLNVGDVVEATRKTNEQIFKGAKVVEHRFDSIEEAKSAFPALRAAEERIVPPVRAIVIGDLDWTACSHEHAKDLSEAHLLLTYLIRKKDRETFEIFFAIGEGALGKIATMVFNINRITAMLNCTIEEIPTRITGILDMLEEQKATIRKLTALIMESGNAKSLNGIKVYTYILDGGDQGIINEMVGKLILKESTVVIASNKVKDNRMFVLARSSDLKMDCSRTLKEVISKHGGNGGGKVNFATGSCNAEGVDTILSELTGAATGVYNGS